MIQTDYNAFFCARERNVLLHALTSFSYYTPCARDFYALCLFATADEETPFALAIASQFLVQVHLCHAMCADLYFRFMFHSDERILYYFFLPRRQIYHTTQLTDLNNRESF